MEDFRTLIPIAKRQKLHHTSYLNSVLYPNLGNLLFVFDAVTVGSLSRETHKQGNEPQQYNEPSWVVWDGWGRCLRAQFDVLSKLGVGVSGSSDGIHDRSSDDDQDETKSDL